MIRINLFKRVVEMLDRLENEIEMLERHLEVLNAVVIGEPIGISKL
jgi:predicted transcriptional regulator